MLEIRFHGRGGQGTVSAAEILANALLLEGKYTQYFPEFGVERRGAPVTVFQRIDRKEILLRSKIYHSDAVVILDPALIREAQALAGLKRGGWLIINSQESPIEFLRLGPFKIATVGATAIALKYKIGSQTQPIVNTVITGAVAKIFGISFESLAKAIEKKFGNEAERNIKGAKEAYETLKILEVSNEQ